MSEKEAESSRRILVAVDGSDHSKKAVNMAIDQAKRWNSELFVIHVMEKMSSALDIATGQYPEWAKKESIPQADYFQMVCSTFVNEAVTKAESAGVAKVESICSSGNPADEIINEAERLKVDMIFMGSRGLGRFSRIATGSVSTKVSQYSHCTVVAVK